MGIGVIGQLSDGVSDPLRPILARRADAHYAHLSRPSHDTCHVGVARIDAMPHGASGARARRVASAR